MYRDFQDFINKPKWYLKLIRWYKNGFWIFGISLDYLRNTIFIFFIIISAKINLVKYYLDTISQIRVC